MGHSVALAACAAAPLVALRCSIDIIVVLVIGISPDSLGALESDQLVAHVVLSSRSGRSRLDYLGDWPRIEFLECLPFYLFSFCSWDLF